MNGDPVPDPGGEGGLGSGISGGTQAIQALARADQAFTTKFDLLGGRPGRKVIPGLDGIQSLSGGFVREYERGTMYLNQRVNSQPLYLETAAIRYSQLGGPPSFLGWPVADEQPDPGSEDVNDGVARFENGAIYFFGDLGQIEVQHLALRFVGLRCIEESSEVSSSDEPYLVFGALPSLVTNELRLERTTRTRVFEGVDSGENHHDNLELYRGPPLGLNLSVLLMEHDHGQPDRFKDHVGKLVEKAADGVAQAVPQFVVEVHPFGVFLAPLTALTIGFAAIELTNVLSDLINTDDDLEARTQVTLTPKEMVRLTRVALSDFRGIQAHMEVRMKGGDVDYLVYLLIEAVPPA